MDDHIYIAIDLKSFYASVECMERGLDPMDTNLVVADISRTEKTICLAVSPSLKSFGIPGRPRLFEVVQKIKEVNIQRAAAGSDKGFIGKSFSFKELSAHPELAVDYIIATPRMAHYIRFSTQIYEVYLKYAAPEDIHVYYIDEVFIDAASYLKGCKLSARELALMIIHDILNTTGITATAGIGTNLYLCKVAMDIVAKHIPADAEGVRIAELDERSYRRQLWSHRPLTDFWRIGKGYAKKLEAVGIYTMGDIAKCSLGGDRDYYNEELLYRMFGVNAELLIDHAWGYEPCTIADIKAYKPESESVGSGQVLQCPYDYEKARLAVKEMADLLSLDLVSKKLVTDQMVLTVGYDIENLGNSERKKAYHGEITTDRYGRSIPKHAHGTANLDNYTSSTRKIIEAVMELYDRIINKDLLIRRIYLTASHVISENDIPDKQQTFEQLDLFTDYAQKEKQEEREKTELKKERKLQEAMLDIRKRFGKNSILKGMNLQEGATAIEKNKQIGGHKA